MTKKIKTNRPVQLHFACRGPTAKVKSEAPPLRWRKAVEQQLNMAKRGGLSEAQLRQAVVVWRDGNDLVMAGVDAEIVREAAAEPEAWTDGEQLFR